jgi:hypothetical protein
VAEVRGEPERVEPVGRVRGEQARVLIEQGANPVRSAHRRGIPDVQHRTGVEQQLDDGVLVPVLRDQHGGMPPLVARFGE